MKVAQITLLGVPRVEVASAALVISRRQPLIVLAFLALAETTVTREQLMHLFWAEAPDEVARRRLRRTIGQLREYLRATGEEDLVRIEGERIALDARRCAVDVLAFKDLATGSRGSPDATIVRCEAADRLYAGPFLHGIERVESPELEHWLLATREQLALAHQRCLAELLDAYMSVGRTDGALVLAERLLGLDPLREETHRTLMRLYAATGRRAEALRQYDRCAALLDAELGVAPLGETRALRDALSRDDLPPPSRPAVAPPSWPIRHSLNAPFLGRDDATAALAAYLDQALRGDAMVACVSGPAGIGKSRLIQETLRAFERPLWLSAGQPTGHAVPYGAILPALRAALGSTPPPATLPDIWLAEASRLLPEVRTWRPDLRLPPSLPPDQAQARLFEALTQLVGALARRSGGAIMVLENLDEADSVSLAWLATLLRASVDLPLGIVAAFRPPAEQGPLRAWLDHAARVGQRRDIALAPLALVAVTALVRRIAPAHLALARQLWAETAGNPFFLLETLRLVIERGLTTASEGQPLPLPATVQEVVLARVRGIAQLPRQIIDTAAILAPTFDSDVLRSVSGRDDYEVAQAVDLLVAADLLVEEASGYRFAHAQIAETLYADIGTARRRILHRRAVEALRHRPDLERAVLAHHLERAGQRSAAAAMWLEAAGQSARVFAAEEALASLSRGLALVTDPDQRYEFLALQDDLLDHLGRRVEQAETIEEMACLAAGLDVARRHTIAVRRGRLLAALGRWAEAEDQLRRALADGAARREASVILAQVLTAQQRWDEAEEVGQRALHFADGAPARSRALHTLAQLARTREDRVALESYLHQALAVTPQRDSLRSRLLLDLGEVLFRQGRHEEASAISTEALHLAQAQASRATEALAHNQLGNCLTRLHRNAEAIDAFRRAAEAHRAIENRAGEAAAVGNLGVLAMRVGRLDEALDWLTKAQALFAALGNIPGVCLSANNLGTTLIWLDRSTEALPHLQLALDRAIAASLPIREAATRCNLGAALLDIGRIDEGVALMEHGARMRDELQYGDACIDHACLAVAYLRVGRGADAERLSARALADLADDASGVGHPQRVAFGRAQVLRAVGRERDAQDALALADTYLERYMTQFGTAEERARYLGTFACNRDLLAARRGHWPDPPRLV